LNLAAVLFIEGDVEHAREHFRAALPILQRNGPTELVGWALHGLGLIALEDGDPERAARLCAVRQSVHRRIGYVSHAKVLEIAHSQLERDPGSS
jgi:hypothetical protein